MSKSVDKIKLIISPEADYSLSMIYAHSLNQWGKKRADGYLDELEKSFEMLCNKPNIGHRHPDISGIYSVFLVGRHWIVYYTEKEQLVIIAIIHSSMQINEQLDRLLTRLK